MGDRRGHVLAVVQEGDDAGVEAFQAPAVVLKVKAKTILIGILLKQSFWLHTSAKQQYSFIANALLLSKPNLKPTMMHSNRL